MNYKDRADYIFGGFIGKGKDWFYYMCENELKKAYAEGFKKGVQQSTEYQQGYKDGYYDGISDKYDDERTRYK